ncbi:D-alanyl-D-alanine carboxypeptidase family protein [Priestia taiwanensis]|uniref:D-alanyl-D-alanine carboxypeptidase n=1 Tax=Priestia taiwanensis TaxID=1347902 RepID=A0A917AR51_9BACI|nr:D-alanyl-D-alanine carboxypeptidase family protein [Priestia taiwanensis]MBM7363125.1 D-alanyl-D-alanine carboxypeptidase [Priestia taiwanensis]GGE67880.1 D-alanyl-D-alanine carboxypeptidase [Priestia taiwanensis]
MKVYKKSISLFAILIPICIILFFLEPYIKGAPLQAETAILMDAKSGEILYSKNEHTPRAPASMSKMMTEYIVLEQIQQGNLKWDELVTISRNASHTEGARIPVKVGDRLTVKDLFHAMVLPSANNATVALAEHIAKTEENFTAMMNAKAKKLKLSSKTKFVNSTGLANEYGEETTMTALDVATLARQLLTNFPDVVNVTKLTSYNIKSHGITLKTTNKMLDSSNQSLSVPGMDGLKTGFTDSAGYCFAGTAIQDDRRVISVVMGTKDDIERFEETKKLFAYGFNRPKKL